MGKIVATQSSHVFMLKESNNIQYTSENSQL
jgi:hypothetical protein